MNFDVYYIKPVGILQVMAFPPKRQHLLLFPPPEEEQVRICMISGIAAGEEGIGIAKLFLKKIDIYFRM